MRIELEDIHKHFGSVRANDGVSLTVEPGTVHGILGENGAGKSTLMKILSGYLPKTSGRILADGRPVTFNAPEDAFGLGIGMLYQDPLDFPRLTVLENFMLGQKSPLFGAKKRFHRQLRDFSHRFGFALDPEASVESLTVGERQNLELLRLLAQGVEVLILDEPTTGISATQKARLFDALRQLAGEGRSVIIVSHKLEDVEALCDRATALRQGRVSGRMDKPFDTAGLLEMMFGSPPAPPPRCPARPGDPVLEMAGVFALGGRAGLKNCTVRVRQGEVVGLAGLEGSGQGLFLRLAAGIKQPVKGQIRLCGRPMTGVDYHGFVRNGVNFLPADRLAEGLIPELTLTEHFALRRKRSGFLVGWTRAYQKAQQQIAAFRIKGWPESPAGSLSGGNQQRLLLSFLSQHPALLLLENPTRGLDLESAHFVWQYLQGYQGQGTAILFSSSELDEIRQVADRVLVFFDGAIRKDLPAEAADAAELGRAIAGKA